MNRLVACNQAPYGGINNSIIIMKLDEMTETEASSESSLFESGNKNANANSSDVREMDVICGRGKMAFHHAGNVRFRDAVARNIDAYNAAEKRLGKPVVVEAIIEEIQRSGGRFLKRDTFRDRWVELTQQQKRDKVSHAIRDATKLGEIAATKKKDTQQKKRPEGPEPFLPRSAFLESGEHRTADAEEHAYQQSLAHASSNHSRNSCGSNAGSVQNQQQCADWQSPSSAHTEWGSHIVEQQHKEQQVLELKAKLDSALQAATCIDSEPYSRQQTDKWREQNIDLHEKEQADEDFQAKPAAIDSSIHSMATSKRASFVFPVPMARLEHPPSPKLENQTQHDSLSNFSCGSLDLATTVNEGEMLHQQQANQLPQHRQQQQQVPPPQQQQQQQTQTPQAQHRVQHQKARRTSSITMTDQSNRSAFSAMEWSMASLDISAVGEQWWTQHTAGLAAFEGLANLEETDSCQGLDLHSLDDDDDGVQQHYIPRTANDRVHTSDREVHVPQQVVAVAHGVDCTLRQGDMVPQREVAVPQRLNVAPPVGRAGSKSLEALAAAVPGSTIPPRRRRRVDSDEYHDDNSALADDNVQYQSSPTDDSVSGSNRSSVSVSS